MHLETEFNVLPARAQAALRQLADAVDGTVPTGIKSWSIPTSELKPGADVPSVVTQVKVWESNDVAFLYFFRRTSAVELTAVERAYSDAKAREKDGRAYARLIA